MSAGTSRASRTTATADDAAYGIFELDGGIIAQINSSWAVRVDRGELVEFQVDGTARLGGRRPLRLPDPAPRADAQAGLEPRPADRPGLPRRSGSRSRTTTSSATGSGPSGKQFLTDVDAGRPHRYDLAAGVRGLQLADAGLRSSREGRRVELDRRMTIVHGATIAPAAAGRWLARGRAEPARRLGRSPRAVPHPDRVRRGPRGRRPARGERPRALRPSSTGTPPSRSGAHLFRYGLGVAEAMDTAQRNMGLDWPATQELITRSAAQARELGARIASGAGTDHRPGRGHDRRRDRRPTSSRSTFVEGAGSQVIVMASRHLAAVARRPRTTAGCTTPLLAQVSEPVILHWLGEVFDPHLRGYWGSTDVPTGDRDVPGADQRPRRQGRRGQGVAAVGRARAELRAALPAGVRLYTGDDFNYPELIEGDGTHHSDALLGAFAAIAPAASAALAALDDDDVAGYDAAMTPTLELSRHIFTDADLLLQDRDRLPGLAFRAPGRLHHGRRPAVGAVADPPGPGLRAGQRGPAAAGSGAGRAPARPVLDRGGRCADDATSRPGPAVANQRTTANCLAGRGDRGLP